MSNVFSKSKNGKLLMSEGSGGMGYQENVVFNEITVRKGILEYTATNSAESDKFDDEQVHCELFFKGTYRLQRLEDS